MVDESLPAVSVWGQTGSEFAVVSDISSWSGLEVDVRNDEPGTWSFTAPDNTRSQSLTGARLVTFDWRGVRVMTGVLDKRRRVVGPDGAPLLEFSGFDAMAIPGWALAWPDPALGLQQQPYWDPAAPAPIVQPAETAALRVLRQNLVDRRVDPVNVAISEGRGATVRMRPDFDNLLDLVTRKLRRNGLALRVGLRETSTGRATLDIWVVEPSDKSQRVVFSRDIPGSVSEWELSEAAPTVTRALVKGAGSGSGARYRSVVTTASTATAAAWFGVRETLSEGPQSYDNTELDDAGTEVLDAGAATTSAQVTAAESGNLLAFRDYGVGDSATWEDSATGVARVDVITSIRLVVDDDGPVVTPTFGDPDANNPVLKYAQVLRDTRRELGRLRKRR